MTLPQYNPHCIFYCDPIKNSIMNDGNFIRIIYATQNITLNGIILQLQVNITGMRQQCSSFLVTKAFSFTHRQ